MENNGQSPTLDDQDLMEVMCPEASPGPGIRRTELGDQRPPISQSQRWCYVQRACVVLGALGLLSGVGIGSWLLVLYLQPPAASPSISRTLPEEEMTLSCPGVSNEEELLPSLPQTASFRINGEDLLLEVQVRTRPDWLLVCHEGWNPALGTRICQSLGHLRLTQHKAVNLSDIKLTRSQEFAQLSDRLGGLLQEAWQPRVRGKASGFSNSRRSSCGFRALAMASKCDAWLPAHVWGLCAGTPLGSDCSPLHVHKVSVCSFRQSRLSSWRVHAGLVSHSAVQQHQGTMVEKIIPHPSYGAQNHDYDVALLKLRTPLNFSDTVGAVCLPAKEQHFPRGSECWVSGWGHTDPGHTHSSDTLQDTVVPLLSTRLCNSSCMYSGALTHRMLCAGYLDGRADACQGDSGGPLVCPSGDKWHLVGVVSWGRGCADPNHPGVYAKVAEFLDWIHDTVRKPASLGSLAGPLATGEAVASDAELWISHGSSQAED